MTDRERFLLWMRRHKLTNRRAARLLGVSVWTINGLRCGREHPGRYMEDTELPALESHSEALWLARKRHALTKKEAAQLLGISATYVYHIENDKLYVTGLDMDEVLEAYRLGELRKSL